MKKSIILLTCAFLTISAITPLASAQNIAANTERFLDNASSDLSEIGKGLKNYFADGRGLCLKFEKNVSFFENEAWLTKTPGELISKKANDGDGIAQGLRAKWYKNLDKPRNAQFAKNWSLYWKKELTGWVKADFNCYSAGDDFADKLIKTGAFMTANGHPEFEENMVALITKINKYGT